MTMNAEALLRHTSDGAAAVGPDGRILLWNKAAETILGRQASEVLGRHCWGVFAGCDVHGNRLCVSPCSVRVLLARGESIRHFTMSTHTRQGDAIWLDVSTLRDPGGAGRPACTVHLFRDVTSQRGADRPLRTRVPESRCAERAHKAGTHNLTPRENEVMELLRAGSTTAELARALGITRTTVRNHVQNIFGKLGVHSRLAAVTRVSASDD